MATTTTNLGLTKPAGTDAVDIAVINANMNTIDTELVKKTGTGQKIGTHPAVIGISPTGDSYLRLLNNSTTRLGYVGFPSNGQPLTISDEASQGISLVSGGAIKINGQSPSLSYDFGILLSANIDEVSAALINKFNTCANGAHNYYGVWSGNYHFGGTIHKINVNIGVLTFFPAVNNSSQSSFKLYNAGAGWNATLI